MKYETGRIQLSAYAQCLKQLGAQQLFCLKNILKTDGSLRAGLLWVGLVWYRGSVPDGSQKPGTATPWFIEQKKPVVAVKTLDLNLSLASAAAGRVELGKHCLSGQEHPRTSGCSLKPRSRLPEQCCGGPHKLYSLAKHFESDYPL